MVVRMKQSASGVSVASISLVYDGLSLEISSNRVYSSWNDRCLYVAGVEPEVIQLHIRPSSSQVYLGRNLAYTSHANFLSIYYGRDSGGKVLKLPIGLLQDPPSRNQPQAPIFQGADRIKLPIG